MAGPPKSLNDLPGPAAELLSQALRRVRISGSMQFCQMPQGDWFTHAALGRLLDPNHDLPMRPWPATPTLHYTDLGHQIRILCGYVLCEATGFAPFRATLPEFIHIRTAGEGAADWLAATVSQIVTEVDQPQPGGGPVLERLTEIALLEILRRQFLAPGPQGWLAAILDLALSRALLALHADPRRDWTLEALAQEGGLSRSALVTRFAGLLGISPMRYLRDWRLFLAAQELALAPSPIITIATKAGYGTEAAFTRAFRRCYGTPPAEWRRARAPQGSAHKGSAHQGAMVS